MNITCPSCQSTYQLADGSLGATGRKVRCTRCGTVWHAMPADEADVDLGPEAIEAAAAKFREPSDDEWKAALAEDGDVASSVVAAEGEADAAGGNVVPFRARDPAEEPAAAEAPAPEPAAEPTLDVDPPGFEPEKRAAKAAKPQRKPLGKPKSAAPRKISVARFAYAAAAVFVLFVIVGAFTGREQVVRLFPDFASLYELAGLEVNLRGLEFSGVETHREIDGSNRCWSSRGSSRTSPRPTGRCR